MTKRHDDFGDELAQLHNYLEYDITIQNVIYNLAIRFPSCERILLQQINVLQLATLQLAPADAAVADSDLLQVVCLRFYFESTNRNVSQLRRQRRVYMQLKRRGLRR